MLSSKSEIGRIARIAFDLARQRNNQVCSIDKANALEALLLWWDTVQAIRDKDYPNGDYVKQWVPELKFVPLQWIHKTWMAPQDKLGLCLVKIILNPSLITWRHGTCGTK